MKSIGIVGLPNVGKSSLFNLITNLSVPAENYPFCTIDKNVGVIEYKDNRLYDLAKIFNSKEVYPATIQFTDIAGLVKGASKGEGLGNQFLSHIREVDLIMFILRGFVDPSVSHVHKDLNPVEDLDIVLTELILKDIESVTKKIAVLEKQAKSKERDKILQMLHELEGVKQWLERGFTAYKYLINHPKTKVSQLLQSLFLLTLKPAIFIINISYVELDRPDYQSKLESWIKDLQGYITSKYGEYSSKYIGKIDTKFLKEIQDLNESDQKEFISSVKEFYDVSDIISLAKDRLKLINFFVGGEKDSRSWFLPKGATAVEAASKIHTDLANNFVKAEVCSVSDIIEFGCFKEVQAKGLVKTVGKEYVVQDGDYLIILATN